MSSTPGSAWQRFQEMLPFFIAGSIPILLTIGVAWFFGQRP